MQFYKKSEVLFIYYYIAHPWWQLILSTQLDLFWKSGSNLNGVLIIFPSHHLALQSLPETNIYSY